MNRELMALEDYNASLISTEYHNGTEGSNFGEGEDVAAGESRSSALARNLGGG